MKTEQKLGIKEKGKSNLEYTIKKENTKRRDAKKGKNVEVMGGCNTSNGEGKPILNTGVYGNGELRFMFDLGNTYTNASLAPPVLSTDLMQGGKRLINKSNTHIHQKKHCRPGSLTQQQQQQQQSGLI